MEKMTPYYRQTKNETEIFENCYKENLPLLLKGPTGTGKSRFVEYMAHKLDRQLYTVLCHEETSATDLIGRYIIKGAETVWLDGPMSLAIKNGAILYLDEIAEARPDIVVAIHSLTDHRRTLFVDKTGEHVKAPDDFMLVASYNPGYQKGFKELKPSTRQRFVAYEFEYPSPELEREIVENETKCSTDLAKQLVKVAEKIRNLSELGLTESVSTRLLVDCAKLVNSGMKPRIAAECAITAPLTDDADTSDALNDLISMIL